MCKHKHVHTHNKHSVVLHIIYLYAMRDVKDMGQRMGYRSLEWNWAKEAMNRPIWAGIVDGAKLFLPFS